MRQIALSPKWAGASTDTLNHGCARSAKGETYEGRSGFDLNRRRESTYASAAETLASDSVRIGTKIQDFSLKNQFGKEYALHDFADRDVVVVAFVGAECPLAQLYGPRLAELARKLDSRRVAFMGIDSNQQDSIQKIGAYAARHQIEFPFSKTQAMR